MSPDSESSMSATPGAPPRMPWTARRRVAFRFATVYWLLFSVPFPLTILPWTDSLAMQVFLWQRSAGAWFGRHVLGLDGELGIDFNGSGDRTVDYLFYLLSLLLAVAITGAWSWLDRRRDSYRRVGGWLHVAVRYYLAYTMFAYGFAKVFKAQFPDPSLGTLVQTYGDSSPMHLLWTFMGYSTPYNVFTGAVEVLAGALLLSRRTTSLGALLVVAVMANIFMLNLSYDVPVKLYSAHLLVLGAALLLPDARRLVDALVLARAAAAPDLGSRPRSRRGRAALLAVKIGVIALMAGRSAYDSYESYRVRSGADLPELYGLYDVATFERDGVEIAPLVTEAARWRYVSVTKWSSLVVTRMDGATLVYTMEHDATAQTIELVERGDDSETAHTLSAVRGPDGAVRIAGTLNGERLDVELRRREPSDFLLHSRGFHWINEFPFNR